MANLLANLGDVDAVEYGGFFVFDDGTAAVLVEPCEDFKKETWELYRFSIDKCTYTDGVLSDNPYHPRLPAWFASDLASVAATCDQPESELIAAFCSDDIVERGIAYQMIAQYYGLDNFDSYPCLLLSRRKAEQYVAGLGTITQ